MSSFFFFFFFLNELVIYSTKERTLHTRSSTAKQTNACMAPVNDPWSEIKILSACGKSKK